MAVWLRRPGYASMTDNTMNCPRLRFNSFLTRCSASRSRMAAALRTLYHSSQAPVNLMGGV